MEALQRLHNRGSISTGYDIDNSLKLESDNTERVNKASGTISSAGNRRTFTISCWTKRTEIKLYLLFCSGLFISFMDYIYKNN